jgi:nitrogen fixation protein NifU and related proteins
MDLKELYRDVILDHNKRPRNFGRLEAPARSARGHNPLCGDQLTVYALLDGEQLRELRFEGAGCAISVASASLMTEAVKGKSRAEVAHLFGIVHDLLTRPDAPAPAELGKLAALSGVRDFPARVKCASLCWHTLNAALAGAGAPVSTE